MERYVPVLLPMYWVAGLLVGGVLAVPALEAGIGIRMLPSIGVLVIDWLVIGVPGIGWLTTGWLMLWPAGGFQFLGCPPLAD